MSNLPPGCTPADVDARFGPPTCTECDVVLEGGSGAVYCDRCADEVGR